MKRKIAVYLQEDEYINLQRLVKRQNKTITAYCKEKIFNIKKEDEKDFLKKHILRQFEDLLYLLISQHDISKSNISKDSLKQITSYAIHIGNLKAKNNKQLKQQRGIEHDYRSLFQTVNTNVINSLVLQVNKEPDDKNKVFILASYINRIKTLLRGSNEKV